jgi:hypothetical protein
MQDSAFSRVTLCTDLAAHSSRLNLCWGVPVRSKSKEKGNLMRNRDWMWVLLIGTALATTPAVSGNEILPGASGAPDVLTLGYSSSPPNNLPRTVLANKSGNWGTTTFGGSFYEQVEADPANVFCAGCLDFLFQVSNNSSLPENLIRVTESGFAGYHTEVGYDSLSLGSLVLCGIDDGGFCNNGDPNTEPVTVDRSADGNVVGFNLPAVLPAESTVDLVIETDALSFIDPQGGFIGSNGGIGSALIFGPSGPSGIHSSTVPEPSSMLSVLGVVCVALRKWRH